MHNRYNDHQRAYRRQIRNAAVPMGPRPMSRKQSREIKVLIAIFCFAVALLLAVSWASGLG
jgi:hypothetical protein